MKTASTNDQFAVFQRGTFQYFAYLGQQLELPFIEVAVGKERTFKEVLLVANGAEALIGAPLVEGGEVTVKVVSQQQTPKQKGFKFSAKSRYRRTYGYRQQVTIVEVTSIASKAGGTLKATAAKATKPEVKAEMASTKPAAKAKAPAKKAAPKAKKPAAKPAKPARKTAQTKK